MEKIHKFEDKIIQDILKSVKGVISDITNINDYEKVIASAGKYEIAGLFDNDGRDKAAVVLKHLYSNSKDNIAVYTEKFTGEVSNKDKAVEGWEKAIKDNPKIVIQVLIDEEPHTHTRVYSIITNHIKDTGLGGIRVLSALSKDYLKKAFTDSIRHGFSLGDANKFRYQTNNETREALCGFNNPTFNKELRIIFDTAFKDSHPISL